MYIPPNAVLRILGPIGVRFDWEAVATRLNVSQCKPLEGRPGSTLATLGSYTLLW